MSGVSLDTTRISERQAWFAGGWLMLALFALILLLYPRILIYGSAFYPHHRTAIEPAS